MKSAITIASAARIQAATVRGGHAGARGSVLANRLVPASEQTALNDPTDWRPWGADDDDDLAAGVTAVMRRTFQR